MAVLRRCRYRLVPSPKCTTPAGSALPSTGLTQGADSSPPTSLSSSSRIDIYGGGGAGGNTSSPIDAGGVATATDWDAAAEAYEPMPAAECSSYDDIKLSTAALLRRSLPASCSDWCCASIHLCVHPSVRPSIYPSICPLSGGGSSSRSSSSRALLSICAASRQHLLRRTSFVVVLSCWLISREWPSAHPRRLIHAQALTNGRRPANRKRQIRNAHSRRQNETQYGGRGGEGRGGRAPINATTNEPNASMLDKFT